MGKKNTSHNGFSGIIKFLLLCLQSVVFILLCASGYSGMFHPSNHPWLVSLGLAFGPILLVYCGCTLLWLLIDFRWFINSLLGLLICGVPIRTFFPINFSKLNEEEAYVKVLSYNVDTFGKGIVENKTEIYDFIHHSAADIVCLQEGGYNSSERPTIDSVMSLWAYKDTTLFLYNTLSLYTHYPIIDKCIVKGPDIQHGAIIYRLKKDNDTLIVINSHFSSNNISVDDKNVFKDVVTQPTKEDTKSNIHYLARKVDDAGIHRARQADTLIKYIKTLGNVPIIMCGDFNDSPLSYVHFQLTQILNDSYTRGGNGPGISYHEGGMYFRIDNILCSDHWNVAKSKVCNRVNGSDHYPICSWLQLNSDKSKH